MDKQYDELKPEYEGNDRVTQQEILEISSIIEDAPYFVSRAETQPILGHCAGNCGNKCKGACKCNSRANTNLKKESLKLDFDFIVGTTCKGPVKKCKGNTSAPLSLERKL